MRVRVLVSTIRRGFAKVRYFVAARSPPASRCQSVPAAMSARRERQTLELPTEAGGPAAAAKEVWSAKKAGGIAGITKGAGAHNTDCPRKRWP